MMLDSYGVLVAEEVRAQAARRRVTNQRAAQAVEQLRLVAA